MASSRKTPQTWIDAGLVALKSSGPDGLRAETLARELGATKGSFYWHFQDVPSFQEHVLTQWLEAASARFDTALEKGDTTVTQLRALGSYRPSKLDQAVRGWAAQNKTASKFATALDKHMKTRIAALLVDLDARHPDFPALIHAAVVAGPKKGSHVETLIDLLLMLK